MKHWNKPLVLMAKYIKKHVKSIGDRHWSLGGVKEDATNKRTDR